MNATKMPESRKTDSQSGIAVTRQVSTALSVGGTTNVNVELPGSHRRTVMDLRIFKAVALGVRSLDVAVDFTNLANANTRGTWAR